MDTYKLDDLKRITETCYCYHSDRNTINKDLHCIVIKGNVRFSHMDRCSTPFICSINHTERKNGVILTLKVESLAELKLEPGFHVIAEYLSQIDSMSGINLTQIFSNYL